MAKRIKTPLEKTREMIKRHLTKIAVGYIAARYPKDQYPEGIKDKYIYLSLTIIKASGDEEITLMYNNEFISDIGDGWDVDFPINEWHQIKIEEK